MKAWRPLFALLVLLLHGLPVRADALVGVVIGVSDGDTLTVLDAASRQHKVRLLGIDAPEKAQPFGQRAKENLSRLAFGREVRVEWAKRDRYGRILGKVLAPPPRDCRTCATSIDAGLAQLNDGMAWWYARYAADQFPADRESYRHAEVAAQDRRAGLWADPHPVPPWDWRRR